MKSLQITRPTLDDPLYSQKNPHQTFLLFFTLITTTPVLLGGVSPSNAMSIGLANHDQLLIWALLLWSGSLLGLLGEFWRGHTWHALALERAGLLMLGAGAALYTYIIATADVTDTYFICGVTAAYAGSCFWRVFQISSRLRWIRKIIQELNAEHTRG